MNFRIEQMESTAAVHIYSVSESPCLFYLPALWSWESFGKQHYPEEKNTTTPAPGRRTCALLDKTKDGSADVIPNSFIC